MSNMLKTGSALLLSSQFWNDMDETWQIENGVGRMRLPLGTLAFRGAGDGS